MVPIKKRKNKKNQNNNKKQEDEYDYIPLSKIIMENIKSATILWKESKEQGDYLILNEKVFNRNKELA